MNDGNDRKKTAPYISFATFQSALDAVANAGVPNIIDRHSFRSFSGGAVAAVLSSFRFFSLIDDSGHPAPELHELASDKDSRQKNIRFLLERHFDTIFSIDLLRATPPQLDEAFGSSKYNVSGATRRKAQAFFLKAAAFADVPIGKLLKNKTRASGPRKARKPKEKDTYAVQRATAVAPFQDIEAVASAATKIVRLSGGGALMLTASVDVLSLTGRDREFVFKVIDLLNDFESANSHQVLP